MKIYTYPTPQYIVYDLLKKFSYMSKTRDFWSVETEYGTFHGAYTERQAEEIGEMLT
jgi:hypothetical protein